MNPSQWLRVAVLVTASFLTASALNPTSAATFDSKEVDPNNFIAVAAPFGSNQHQLLIIEQVSNRRPCWSENGNNPVNVEPLLLNFDFTGICGRSTDSNGYSIRMDSQDLGLEYILRIVERNGELVLVGTHRINRKAPEIEVGRTQGLSDGFEKIFLNPGWRFTRRTYQGKTLGHVYLTSDSGTPAIPETNPTAQPEPSTPERELIFTKPQGGITSPPASPPGKVPTTSPQTLPSPPPPESTVPAFVVPTTLETEPITPEKIPATSPQTLPPPPTTERGIPVFVVPTK